MDKLQKALKIILQDKELLPAYRIAEIEYYPVKNIKAALEESHPDALRQLEKQSVAGGRSWDAISALTFTLKRKDKLLLLMYIQQDIFENMADTISILDHKLWHVNDFVKSPGSLEWTVEEESTFDWSENEISTFAKSIKHLDAIINRVEKELGSENIIVFELRNRALPIQKKMLSTWQLGK